jgi:hypothetical protein
VIAATTPARPPWCERHARALGFLGYTALAFIWFHATWADPRHRHAGVIGDPESYMFALAWPRYAVTHHMNPFSTTWLLAPKGANLMWTVPPGFGLLLWPLLSALGLVVTYNVLATMSLAFSAWTAQLALRRFVPGELGPLIGGLFYGFSPYMAAHSLAHVMLTMVILPPLLLLLLHEALVRQRWRPAVTGLAIGALLAFQISTFLELVAGGAVAAVVLIVVLAVSYRREIVPRLRYVAVTAGVAVASFAILAADQLWTLLFGARSLVSSDGVVHPRNRLVADLYGFVIPSPLLRIAPGAFDSISRHFGPAGPESNAYIGVPLLVVVGYVVVRHRSAAVVRITAIVTLVMAILSMGPRLRIAGNPTIPLPWALIQHLPLLQNLLPVRLAVFTDLGIALLLAYGIGYWQKPVTPSRVIVRVLAAAAIAATLLPSATLQRHLWSPAEVPPYFTSSEVKKIPNGSVALVAPWTTDPRNVLPELWQAAADFRFKLASGYAYIPRGEKVITTGEVRDDLEVAMRRIALGREPADLGNEHVRANLRHLLKQHDIATVIVGPMDFEAEMVRYFTHLLGRAPERVDGVYVWYDVDRPETS